MGKGHKERRREQRAREMEERAKQEQTLKQELELEQQEKLEKYQALKEQQEKEREEQREKVIETSSDTDSGLGSSTTISNESATESTEQKKRRSLIKGLYNIGNTCFFNVVIQSLAHTSLLVDRLYEEKCAWIENNYSQYFSTTTAQLLKLFDEFTSDERKKPSIDPKPLFNSLIQKIPCYKDYGQHDSHELFMNLMLILRAEEIELRKLRPRSIAHLNYTNDASRMFCLIGCNDPYTTYDSVFGGHFLDVITCKKCQKSLMKIEPFLGILLPLSERTSPGENYRQRRKREDYNSTKTKKEPKLLSRKQQKALKKQEKKNSRRAAGTASRLKDRNSAKKKPLNEEIPEESSTTSVPSTEEQEKPKEEISSNDSTDAKAETPLPTNEPDTPAEEKNEEEGVEGEEDDDEEKPAAEEDSDADDEPKGPLTTTESTCVLADMVSKLTLIHETSSRPLPFVDERIAQQFLSNATKAATTSNTDGPASENTEDFKTLEHCFQRFFRCETLSGENSFDCYYCRSLEHGQKRVLTEATRQTVFFQLPPILPVFLKRFQMHGSHSEKIQKYIQFPLELNLNNHCSPRVKLNSFTYTLFAVIEHTGTLRSGHYVAYIKQSFTDDNLSAKSLSKPIDELLKTVFHPTNDEHETSGRKKPSETSDPSFPPPAWYYISDNAIHKVPESKVLEADAYVLFYRRV